MSQKLSQLYSPKFNDLLAAIIICRMNVSISGAEVVVMSVSTATAHQHLGQNVVYVRVMWACASKASVWSSVLSQSRGMVGGASGVHGAIAACPVEQESSTVIGSVTHPCK